MLAALQTRMKNALQSTSVAPEVDQVSPLHEAHANEEVAKVVVKGKPSVLVGTNSAHNKSNSKLKWGSRKLDYSHVKSKVPFKDNEAHTPGGGDRQIWHQRLDLSHVRPRVESTSSNSNGGGSKNSTPMAAKASMSMWKVKVDVRHVASKVGSLDNITHVPGGGDKKIFSEKPRFEHVRSRVGSLDFLAHQPGGGDKKIFSEKPRFDHVRPRVGSLDALTQHRGHKQKDKGGEAPDKGPHRGPLKAPPTPEPAKTQEQPLKGVTQQVRSRVGSLEKINHVPGGGDKKIFTQRLSFDHVRPRIGSLDNIAHVPGGGDKKIYNQPVAYEYYTGKAVVVVPPSASNPTSDRSSVPSDNMNSDRKAADISGENGRRPRVHAGSARRSPSSRGSSVGGPVETVTDLNLLDDEE